MALRANPSVVNKIFSSWFKASADSAIITTKEKKSESATNIANAMLATGSMRVLDYIYHNERNYTSGMENGSFDPKGGVFFSRIKPPKAIAYRYIESPIRTLMQITSSPTAYMCPFRVMYQHLIAHTKTLATPHLRVMPLLRIR